jgi:hypothetical protein
MTFRSSHLEGYHGPSAERSLALTVNILQVLSGQSDSERRVVPNLKILN